MGLRDQLDRPQIVDEAVGVRYQKARVHLDADCDRALRKYVLRMVVEVGTGNGIGLIRIDTHEEMGA